MKENIKLTQQLQVTKSLKQADKLSYIARYLDINWVLGGQNASKMNGMEYTDPLEWKGNMIQPYTRLLTSRDKQLKVVSKLHAWQLYDMVEYMYLETNTWLVKAGVGGKTWLSQK